MTKEEIKSAFNGHNSILDNIYLSPLLMCGNSLNESDSLIEDTIESLLCRNKTKTNLDILNDINSIAISLERFETNIAIDKLKRLFIYFMEKIDD